MNEEEKKEEEAVAASGEFQTRIQEVHAARGPGLIP